MFGLKQHTALIASLLLGMLPYAAQANYVEHGRISFDAGGGLIKGIQDSDYSHAPINTLVLAGDTLWADEGTTTEVEFSFGNYLRMADRSKVDVVTLPPNTSFRGWQGSFYIQRLNQANGDLVFETPACRIQVQKDTMVRIDILSNGATTISVRWGRTTIYTDLGQATQLRTGKQIWIDPGYLPSEPAYFNKHHEDVFDTWNRERAELLVAGHRTQPNSVSYSSNTMGYNSLNRYGDWVYVDGRQCWRPTVVNNYIPYRYGSWISVRGIGDVWVGNYPFSYITSHYGRWHHNGVYGWVWSYHRDWSPAWCTTIRYGDHFLWTPVDYYHRPVLVRGYNTFSIGGVRFSMYATSCVGSNNLFYGSSYISPIQQSILNSVNPYGSNINIWNINIGNRPQVNTPFNTAFTVRNYSPRRSIRGPLESLASGLRAADRVRTLESDLGSTTFTRNARTTRSNGTVQRTASTQSARESRLRTIKLNQTKPVWSRATRENPVEAASTIRRTNTERTVTSRVPRSNAESNGTLNLRTSRRSESNTPYRTITRTTPSTRGTGDTPSRTITRNSPSTRITPTTRGNSDTPSRTVPRNNPGSRITTTTPSRSITRNTPSARTEYSTPSRTISRNTPEPRSSISTPSRRIESSPRTSTPPPSRSISRDSTGPRISTPAPSRTISRNTPSPSARPSTPAPSRSITRSAPAPSARPSSPAPSRSITRSAPAPSARPSTPAPSRSITRSAPAPSARPSAPAPSHSISRSAPAPSSRGSISRSSRSSR